MAASGPWTFTDAFRTKLLNRYINGGTALTFKCGLYLSTSNIGVASTTIAGVTNEHAAANGYAAVPVAFTLVGTTTVGVRFTANPSFTANGGDIVFRWAVLYETGGDVVAFSLSDTTPANVTIPNGSGLIIDSDGAPLPIFDAA